MTATPSIADRRAALDLIMLKHCSRGGALSCILDYLDDPAAISSPTLITALDILNGADPDDADITRTIELTDEFDPDFARALACRAEICIIHYCDFDICRDEH